MLLLRPEWYIVLKILHCKMSPITQLKEKVKFQYYILHFLGFCHCEAIYENTYKSLHKSTERIIGILSRMSILNDSALEQDISLYSPIILPEFNCFIILRFKITRFVLYLWRPRYLQLILINRLSKLSFIIFRVCLCFGFELAQHKLQLFGSLLITFYYQSF